MSGVNFDPVLYIGISQSFFAGLLIATRKPISIATRLMAAWLFMICIEMIFALLNSNIIEMYAFPFITFTYGPLLYLYIKFMTRRLVNFNFFSLLHFVPFLCFFIISVIYRDYPLIGDLRGFFKPDKLISLRIIYGTCFFISITVYSLLSFLEIKRHQANLKNLVSFTSGVITLNWLKILSVSFYCSYFIFFILGGLKIFGNYIPFDPYFIIFGFITLFSFVYSFYGIKQPAIFGSEITVEGEDRKETEKYARSGLKNEQAKEYLQRLLTVMEQEKPYLSSELTIHELSVITGIHKHHITQVLNEEHGRNFFTFINEYRVKEVISRFGDPKYNRYTILAIAYDAGFNSKTTFNAIFKNQTGLTPSQFRDKLASR